MMAVTVVMMVMMAVAVVVVMMMATGQLHAVRRGRLGLRLIR